MSITLSLFGESAPNSVTSRVNDQSLLIRTHNSVTGDANAKPKHESFAVVLLHLPRATSRPRGRISARGRDAETARHPRAVLGSRACVSARRGGARRGDEAASVRSAGKQYYKQHAGPSGARLARVRRGMRRPARDDTTASSGEAGRCRRVCARRYGRDADDAAGL